MREFTLPTAMLRLGLAVLVGAIIGYGRYMKNRPAGFRTYMMISLGAAMSVLLEIYLYEMLQGPWGGSVEKVGLKYDGSRLVSQSITGIGFLGAALIIKGAHQHVKGLTTATGLFATVCVGIAAGAGFYELVVIAGVLNVLVLNVMAPMEDALKFRLRNVTLLVEFDSVEDIDKITDVMQLHHAQVYDTDIERYEQKGNQYPCATFTIRLSKHHSHSEMLSSLAELDCVHYVGELIE